MATQETIGPDTQNDGDGMVNSSKRHAQSFIASSSYSLTGCRIPFKRQGAGSPNAVVFNLRACSNDAGTGPTGSVLATHTQDLSGVSTSVFENVTITFDTPYNVTSGVQYCIEWYPNADGILDGLHTPSIYANGSWWYSIDSGATWTNFSSAYDVYDMLVYGDAAGGGAFPRKALLGVGR